MSDGVNVKCLNCGHKKAVEKDWIPDKMQCTNCGEVGLFREWIPSMETLGESNISVEEINMIKVKCEKCGDEQVIERVYALDILDEIKCIGCGERGFKEVPLCEEEPKKGKEMKK